MLRKIQGASAVIGDTQKETSDGLLTRSALSLLKSANDELVERGMKPISLDEYALARALRSEHGSGSENLRRWVAWAIRNALKGKTFFEKITRSNSPRSSGFFARQRTDARFVASNLAPRLTDITIAKEVVRASSRSDPTGGATNFFSPRTQDILFRRAQDGDPKLVGRITRDADAVIEKWERGGLEVVGAPPGVSEETILFFRPERRFFS